MKSRTFCSLAAGVCVVVCGTALLAGEGELRAYVSAPPQACAGSEFRVPVLIVNDSDAAVTFQYEATAEALALDGGQTTGRVWLAPKAALVMEWRGKAEKECAASFTLSVNGAALARCDIEITGARRAATAAAAGDLRPGMCASLPIPQRGGKYEVELELTAGTAGELAATLERLRAVSGFDANMVVLRDLVPRAVSPDQKEPDLSLLYAIQDRSGGWGAAPDAAPDLRTTSWVVFWLGLVAKTGVTVQPGALKAAVSYLRQSQGEATPDMQARILVALAANGLATEKELAAFSEAKADGMATASRLLAACGGANVPLPPQPDWQGLNALELSLLSCCILDKNLETGGFPLASTLVRLRGGDPRFDTHEAGLYALALGKLAARAPVAPFGGKVSLRVSGRTIERFKLEGGGPAVRKSLKFTAPSGKDASLELEFSAAEAARPDKQCAAWFRLRLRPAD